MNILTKLCLVCGKEFAKPYSCGIPEWQNTRKTCSRTCADKLKIGRTSWNKNVPWTEEQRTLMSSIKKGKHYSPKTEFKKGFTPWNKNKNQRVEKTCLVCSKTFSVVSSRKNAKYCSQKCNGTTRIVNQPQKNCIVCNSSFQKRGKETKERWLTRKVCSRKCQYKTLGWKAESHPNWRGANTVSGL